MNEVAIQIDSVTPVIIDDKLRTGGATEIARPRNFVARFVGGAILDAQLHKSHALRQQARQPVGGIDDEIERIEMHDEQL
jgi:hypothetical protein